ncbi:MAG: hypothetical protein AB7P99_14510 [Vicinamibacterales bacterium]
MKTMAALMLLLAAAPAAAQAPAAATPQVRALRCFAAAHTLNELIDVSVRNLALVANTATQGAGAEQQQVMMGMLASGTLADQQAALDLAEQLELCVAAAVAAAAPDAAALEVARLLAAETQYGIDSANGFSSDFERVAPAINRVLAAANDPGLQAAANGTYSQFGRTISDTLHRVRLAVSELLEKSR